MGFSYENKHLRPRRDTRGAIFEKKAIKLKEYLFSGTAGATACARGTRTTTITGAIFAGAVGISAITFFCCCFHCLRFNNESMMQSYGEGKGRLLYFKGNDLYNFLIV
jgi:hypothetical protein